MLFRSRGDWEIYLRSLREAGVPFAVEGDRHYYKRREIVDAEFSLADVIDQTLALYRSLLQSAGGYTLPSNKDTQVRCTPV